VKPPGRLPDHFKAAHGDIDWSGIIGLRNRIVHDYAGIDLELLWQVVKADIPGFLRQVDRLN
jgi:uncharacterized protein with HEPN domain